jgi:uncharacterized protein (DUF1684 family)
MRSTSLPTLLLLAASFGCARTADHGSEILHRREIESWRADRLARLTSQDGWLTLAGLFWLQEGENSVGSDPSDRVVLPKATAPARAAELVLEGGRVRLAPEPGSGLTVAGRPAEAMSLQSDAGGASPTVVRMGGVSFFVIKRGEKLGVRVRDTESAARRNFKGLDYFPIDSRWRVEARFELYSPQKTLEVPTVLGTPEKDVSPGAFVFTVGGKSYRLDPVIEEGSEDLFIIFGDETNGKETYGAGRFVYAPVPKDGRSVIDFNKAYNPPCAFTPYATCPLPPPQNRLPIRVEAGEKKYAGGHH